MVFRGHKERKVKATVHYKNEYVALVKDRGRTKGGKRMLKRQKKRIGGGNTNTILKLSFLKRQKNGGIGRSIPGKNRLEMDSRAKRGKRV